MDRLLTEKEVAEILGVKPRTLRDLRAKRRGPRWRRVARFVRYTVKDVEAWVAKRGTA